MLDQPFFFLQLKPACGKKNLGWLVSHRSTHMHPSSRFWVWISALARLYKVSMFLSSLQFLCLPPFPHTKSMPIRLTEDLTIGVIIDNGWTCPWLSQHRCTSPSVKVSWHRLKISNRKWLGRFCLTRLLLTFCPEWTVQYKYSIPYVAISAEYDIIARGQNIAFSVC